MLSHGKIFNITGLLYGETAWPDQVVSPHWDPVIMVQLINILWVVSMGMPSHEKIFCITGPLYGETASPDLVVSPHWDPVIMVSVHCIDILTLVMLKLFKET